jgi:DNA polymerase (family 10)
MTGRLLLSRDGYEIEVDQVLEAAAKNSVAIEINSNCHRLDIDWRLHQKAVSLGIVLPICPDAHSVNGIHDIEYGVRVARKGLLTPKVIPTCWDLEQINNFFQSKRNA